MNFSIPIKYTGISVISPNGIYLAVVQGIKVNIYKTSHFETPENNQITPISSFNFIDFPSHLEFSNDSKLFLVGLFKRGMCSIRSLDSEDWIADIDEGLAGMVSARFSPDGRRILTVSEFNVRLDIWSLSDKSQMSINYPKFADKGISFTNNGFFMALAERHDAKDHIGIYYVGDFTLINHFAVEMFDLQDLQWSKDDTCLIVWDSCLECKFSVYSPNGNIIATHNPYDLMLGIKNVSQSPNGNYLAVGYYDEVCRFYNHLSWKLIMDFDHNQALNDTSAINVFKEEEQLDNPKYPNSKKTANYKSISGPIKLTKLPMETDKPNPNIGISDMSWSFDSNFLATKNDATPNVLWIWQVSSLSLHTIIIQINAIKSFSWSPTDHMLLICTENSKLYSFTLSKIYVFEIEIDMKKNLAFNKITWSEDGKFFTLQDKNNFIIGNPLIANENKIEENEEDQEPDHEQESGIERENNYHNNQSNDYENNNNYNEGENYNDENYNEEDNNDNYNNDQMNYMRNDNNQRGDYNENQYNDDNEDEENY